MSGRTVELRREADRGRGTSGVAPIVRGISAMPDTTPYTRAAATFLKGLSDLGDGHIQYGDHEARVARKDWQIMSQNKLAAQLNAAEVEKANREGREINIDNLRKIQRLNVW